MSEATEYIRDTWDSLVHGKKNKRKKNEAIEDINDFIENMAQNKVPDKPTLPDAPTYERATYDAPTDEQLHKSAEEEWSAYKAQGEKGIDDEIAKKRKAYEEQTEKAQKESAAEREKTSQAYAAAKQDVDDDMLKRGLARSSIAANKRVALSEKEAAALTAIADAAAQTVRELGEKIAALDGERQAALNDFNLTYAARITARINELKDERDKKQAEVLKYNNSLTEKEHAAKVDKQMKESDLYGEALSQRKQENELRQNTDGDDEKLYAAVAEKLRALNRHDARDLVLNNHTIRDKLSSTYYYRLYDEFCR